MSNKVDFGVLYGQKTTEDALLIYSSYEDAKASPQTGDFIVLTPKDEGNTKYLARVEAEIYDEDPIFTRLCTKNYWNLLDCNTPLGVCPQN